MRRRIILAATAVAGVSLALLVGIAPASGHGRATTTTTTQTVTLTCNFNLTSQPKAGSTSVTPDDTSGQQYGRTACTPSPATAAPANFGKGVMFDNFSVADNGDTIGSYTDYFLTGVLRGKFDLTPQEGSGGFTSATYTGTGTITTATGAYRGTTPKKPATLNCSTNDGVHYACTESVTLTMPAPAS